ncbi:hypothetical protein E2C01_097889 [Portunus trituberculatus]|uniref:Uncharacterized protein n=1 Tax=Portunus trituberculatus TaxID=210409 RepID=A0A5B7JWC4_PORTR|nr:hypothetical protein [Portunus trituberculatus]
MSVTVIPSSRAAPTAGSARPGMCKSTKQDPQQTAKWVGTTGGERPARHQPPLWRAPAGLVWPPRVHHKAFDGLRPPRGRHGAASPLL